MTSLSMSLNLPTGDFTRYLIFLPRTQGEIIDAAAYAYLYSPDAFPNKDWQPETLQNTHDSMFWLLHTGVDHVFDAPRHAAARDRMHDLLNRSYTEFLEDESIIARELLEEFRSLVSQMR